MVFRKDHCLQAGGVLTALQKKFQATECHQLDVIGLGLGYIHLITIQYTYVRCTIRQTKSVTTSNFSEHHSRFVQQDIVIDPLIITAGDFNYPQLCWHSDDVVEPVDAAFSTVLDILNDSFTPVCSLTHKV